MKFLVTARAKDILFTLPEERQGELLKANTAYTEKHLKAGKCKEVYLLPDMKGSVGIWNIESAEDAARLCLGFPSLAFYDVDIVPLIDYDAGMKAITEMLP